MNDLLLIHMSTISPAISFFPHDMIRNLCQSCLYINKFNYQKVAVKAEHVVYLCLTIIATVVKIRREIVKYFKLNDNKILAYQNVWDAVKQYFEGKL